MEIIFEVTEDPIDGGFVASALGHGITTEADTLTDLRQMVKDAVQSHFQEAEQMRHTVGFKKGLDARRE